jgi:hypothetical protein
MITADQAVANGVAFLDEHGPDGWRDKINLETLCISSSQNCPLGQVYGGFFVGWPKVRKALGHEPEAYTLGFDVHTDIDNEEMLQAWRDALKVPAPAAEPTVRLTLEDAKLLVKRLKQIENSDHSLMSTELVIQGVRFKLGN